MIFDQLLPYLVMNRNAASSSLFGSVRFFIDCCSAATVSGQSLARLATPVFGRAYDSQPFLKSIDDIVNVAQSLFPNPALMPSRIIALRCKSAVFQQRSNVFGG